MRRSLLRFVVAGVMGAMVLVLAMPAAMAEGQLDQEQASQNNRGIVDMNGWSQSFTAEKSGKLDKVSLLFSCCYDGSGNLWEATLSSGDLHIKVAGAAVSVPVDGSDPPSDVNYGSYYWKDIPLDPAPEVVAGQQYYIDAFWSESSSLYPAWGAQTGNVYAGGSFYQLRHLNGDARVIVSNYDAAFRTYVTPSEAPVITDTTPGDGDTSVARNIEPTAKFDRDLDSATVTADSVKLEVLNPSKNKWVPVNSTPSYDDKTITIDPETDLGARKEYRVTLSTGIKSSTGEELGSEERWSFTTK